MEKVIHVVVKERGEGRAWDLWHVIVNKEGEKVKVWSIAYNERRGMNV